MQKHLIRSFLLSILLLPGISNATAITTNSVNSLMQLSGLNKQIDEIPAGVLTGMQQSMQQGAPLDEQQHKKIEKSVNKSFTAERIKETVSSSIKRSLDESDAEKLLDWYKSDLGKRITKAEETAAKESAYQDMLNQAQALMSDNERVGLARQIDNLVMASDMSLDFQKSTAIAVYTSISKAMRPDEPVNVSAFEAELAKQEPQMRQQIEQFVTLSLVYNYRDFSIGEIKQYIDFLEQPSTKKFNNSAITGMKTGLNTAVEEMADSLAEVFASKQ